MLARRWFAALLLGLVLSSQACSEPVDLKQVLQVADVTSGWFDAGVVSGKNKLVPTVSFRLRKPADVDISSLSLNMVFKRDGEDDGEDVFVQRVDFVSDTDTAPITARPEFGYTGDPPQTRAQMLNNSHFRDVTAQIFAKQSSTQWVELHRVKIARQLLTR